MYKFFDIIKRIFKLFTKILVSIGLFFITIGAITGVTGIFAVMAAPVLNKLRKTKGEEMDELHGIEYHDVKPVYTIHELKGIIKQKRIDIDNKIIEDKHFLEDYIRSMSDNRDLQIRREGEFDYYDVKNIKREGKRIIVTLVELMFKDQNGEPISMQGGHKVGGFDNIKYIKNEIITYAIKTLPVEFKNGAMTKVTEKFEDVEDTTLHNKTVIELMIQQFIDYREAKLIKPKGNKMSAKECLDTVKEIQNLYKFGYNNGY